MDHFDFRHVILMFENIFISGIRMPWQLNPFNIHQFTFMEASILLVVFVIFSTTSINIRPNLPFSNTRSRQWQICIRVGDFFKILTLSLLVCLAVPKHTFWYAYTMIILISLWYNWLAKTFNSFLYWLQEMSPSMPVFNIFVVTRLDTASLNLEEQQHSSGIEAV